jgi:hypothetical protein
MGSGASSSTSPVPSSSPAAASSKDDIYFIDAHDFLSSEFRSFSDLNSNPNNVNYLIHKSQINFEKSFIIFISHSWIHFSSRLTPAAGGDDKESSSSASPTTPPPYVPPLHLTLHNPRPPSSPSSSSSDFPDNLQNEKFSLCQEGVRILWQILAKDLSCYLWIDCCCTNVLDRETPIDNIEEIIELSDVLFTPIPAQETIPLTPYGIDLLVDYPLKLWNLSKYAYTNRDICRWEMYLGSSLPLSSHSSLKIPLFHAGLPQMIQLKKRMHFLYDSNMRRQSYLPFSLPITSKSFQSLLPKVCYSNRTLAVASSAYFLSEKQQTARTLLQKQSQSQCESDGNANGNGNGLRTSESSEDNSVPVFFSNTANANEITAAGGGAGRGGGRSQPIKMMNRPLPLLAALHTVTGDQDHDDSNREYISGYHIRLLENGDQYEGEWMDGKLHGKGKLITSIGAVITGTWSHDLLSGIGRYVSPLDEVYEGQWLNNHWHGEGQFQAYNGDVYRGEFRYGLRHGDGEFISALTGNVYTGQWKNNQWNGYGKLTILEDKDKEREREESGGKERERGNGKGKGSGRERVTYEGEWNHGVLNGKGVYEREGVERYEGEWREGQWDGYGIHTTYASAAASAVSHTNSTNERGSGSKRLSYQQDVVREGYWKTGEFLD